MLKLVYADPMKNSSKPMCHFYFSLDASLSMGYCWEEIIHSLERFLNRISRKLGDEFELAFSIEFFQEEVVFSLHKVSLAEFKFKNIPIHPKGGSGIYQAISRGLEQLEDPHHTVFVLITDGHPNGKSDVNKKDLESKLREMNLPKGSAFYFLGENLPIDLSKYKILIKGMYRYEANKLEINGAFDELEGKIQDLSLFWTRKNPI